MPTVIAGITYFSIVFGAGFFLGIFREMIITPVYGKTTAVLLEAPFMLVAIAAGAWIAVHRSKLGRQKLSLAMIGVIGVALVQIADFGVGLGLRGMNFADQLGYLKTTAGQIYIGLLGVFLLMPLMVGPFTRSEKSVAMPSGVEDGKSMLPD